jgi:hypothetical protein
MVTKPRHASLFKPFVGRPKWLQQSSDKNDAEEQTSDKQCDVTEQDGNNNDNRKNTTKQQTAATLPWQTDSNFIKWLQMRQSDIGTPKVDLIDIVEGVYSNKFYMYKLRFATRAHVTGWVPQFIVLQYWSKQKLDSWNSTNVDSLKVQAFKPTATEEALAEFPVGTKVAKIFDLQDGQQWFKGSITGCDSSQKWYRVLYEDGDAEEYFRTELVKLIFDYQQQYITRRKNR